MTSKNIYLKRIDELTRGRHPYLQPTDEIYYLGEYTVRQLSHHSPMNRLILNYKKPKDRATCPDWQYKEKAILKAANMFRNSIFNTINLSDRVKKATLIPIPPSMDRSSPMYDDRALKMLKNFMPSGDIRELILQNGTRPPLHVSKDLRTAEELKKNFFLDEELINPAPEELWLFDDVLTKGTHFRAAYELIRKSFPNIPVVGFFIARTIEHEQQIDTQIF